MRKWPVIGALAAIICAVGNSGIAQPINPAPKSFAERSALWKEAQKSCNATAALPPLPIAQAIGSLAKAEHSW